MTNKFSCFLTQKGRWLTATLFLLFTMGIGQMWAEQGVDYSCGFESGTDSWGKSSMSSVGEETTNVRTGAKSLKCSCSNANGYANRSSVTIHRQSTNYIHFILWAKSSASTTAYSQVDGNSGSSVSVGSSGWTQIVSSKSITGSGTTTKTFKVYPGMGSGSFYIDDAIIYYSTNSKTDISYPNSPTAGDISSSKLKWTNRDDSGDGATGRQATLIWKWKNNGGDGDDLTLNNQGNYVVPATGSTLDQSGHWELVSATVAANATEYEGTFTPGDKYAIVHRDLAYNYSAPAYVTIPAGATYDATFANGGHGTAPANASSVSSVTLTQITGVSGWRHTGWTANVATKVGTTDKAAGDALAIGATVTLLQNTAFTAVWAQEFGVSYNANGASGDAPTNSNKYIAGEKFNVAGAGTMVAPTNKAFGGWQYSTTTYAVNDEFTMPAADVEFMAVWNTSYTVTYKANNGTEEADVVVNNPATIATCSFTAPLNKTFKEWTTNEDGTGDKYAPGATVSTTLTLYAQWKNAPQTLFEWTAANTSDIEADNTDLSNATYGTLTTGTSVAGRSFKSTPNKMTKSNVGYKFGNNDVCIEIQGTSNFVEGDTVIITGVCGGDGARSFAVAPSTTTDAVADTVLTNTQADKTNLKEYKVVITDAQAGAKMRIFRLAGNSMYCKSIKVIRPAGVKPTVSFSSNKSEMYTNETATLTFTSQNTNPVTYTIKKSGAVTTDASITGTTFEATVAGEYEIIATQASDGDFWAVEKSITITVNATIPVSSVTVAGAATGYIGNATTLTATAEYATQYRWYVDGTVQTGEEAATFAFTPTEAKTYSIVCEAKNQFNSDWIASTAHSITGSHLYGEIIRATLTDGTHATVTGLVGGTADPNLTQSNKKMDNDKYFGVQLAAGAAFKEGDTVIIAMTTAGGNYPCLFEDKDRTNVLYLATEGSSALEYKFVLPAAATGITTVYISRHDNDYKWNPVVSYMSVVRPKAKKSTVESLTAVTVNSTAITAGELTTLLAGHEVEVATAYPGAPEVVFTKHTVITYVDDSNKAEDTPINVTAVLNGTKWEASTTINATPYTVKAAKLNSAKVYYYDGATKLGEETVAINGSPIHAGDYDDKNLTSFDGWYNNSDLALEHKIADIAALIVTADINVYGKWTNQYATSINIEQWVLDNGKGVSDAQKETQTGALVSLLGTRKFASNIAYDKGNIELDSLNDDPSKTNRNNAYLGLKVKKSGKMLDFRLANGQTAKVKFGNVAATPKVSINGADYDDMEITDGVYSYTATGNDYVSIKTASDGALVFKQIMINEDIQAVALPYLVTYDANGGTCATESAAGASVALPAVTAPADYTFTGWYNGDTKVGNAGQTYVPTSNITLQAHFAPVEYAIAYDGNGETSGSMSAGVAGWGTLVTPDANAFVKTGHVFSGWVITKTSDGSATGITFSEGKFEMPKYDVTLVAQWDDVSKVVKIVETDVKYESFAEAIAAVGAGQTIQLIQNCEYDTYWDLAVAGTVTLDLNGHDLTYTGAKRGVQVESGAKLVLMDGTATVAPTIDLTASPMSRSAITYTSGTFDSKDGMCALAGGEIEINSGRYLATEGVILVKGQDATATVNDGVLICRDNSVIGGNGTNNADFRNYVMNIHGGILYGEIFSAGYASMVVYHPNVGSLNIDGGILVSTNGPCVVTRGGATNITGGTLVAIGSGAGKCGDASLVLPAVGIAADFKSAYPGVASTDVAISGTVDVTGEAGAVQAVYAGATPSAAEVEAIGVSGGTFNTELTNEVCAVGYVPVTTPNAQGKYGVTPKDGAEIIRMDITPGSSAATVVGSGAYYKATPVNIYKSAKIKDPEMYIGFVLKDGCTFAEGDKLYVETSAAADRGYIQYFASADAASPLKTTTYRNEAATGIELPAEVAGLQEFYIKRTTSDGDGSWNPTITAAYVTRVMYPTIDTVRVTINDWSTKVVPATDKTVAIEVPYSKDAEWDDMVVSFDIITNDNTQATIDGNSAWEKGVAKMITLTDKDDDATHYQVTISVAAAATDATLSALTVAGCTLTPAFDPAVLSYNVEVAYGTTPATLPAVTATKNHVGANVAEVVATVLPGTSTYTVTAEDGSTKKVYEIHYTIAKWAEKVIFDGSYMTAMATSPTSETELRWAVVGFNGVEKFSYQTTYGEAYCSDNDKTYSVENAGKYEYYQLKSGGTTKNTRYFKISVPTGYVAKFYVVYGSHSQDTEAKMYVGTAYGSTPTDQYLLLSTSDRYQLTGGMSEIVGTGDYYLNVTSSADFAEVRVYLRKGYYRDQMLGNGVYGTVCVDHNVAFEDIYGATFYELVGQEPTYGKIAFDEIISGQLEAGKPYLFQANGDKLILFYGDETAATPDNSGALKGTYVDRTFSVGEADNIYFFRDHALWSAKETGVKILANRAWLDMSAITPATPNPAPGRRRVTMAINGKDTATDFENLDASDQPIKIMINGQMYILRGEKMYDATGRLVK